jgi:hypothetical protein
VGLVFMLVITRLSVLFNFRQRVFG